MDNRYTKEIIPNSDSLFYRVHFSLLIGNPVSSIKQKVHFTIFRSMGGSMSTGWEKYTTPQNMRKLGRKPDNEYHIVKLCVDGLREHNLCVVEHSPTLKDVAHTDVYCLENLSRPKKTRIRKAIATISEYILI